MSEADAIDLLQSAIWTVIAVSGPCVTAAMVVGIAISFLQALTQIQEVTLTFVPKIMAILFAAMVSAYYMGATLVAFSTVVYSRIEGGF